MQAKLRTLCLSRKNPPLEPGNQANLVSNPMRHERGLAVVENDGFLLVEPTLRVINLGAEGLGTGRADPIPELSPLGIEHLAFSRQLDVSARLRRLFGVSGAKIAVPSPSHLNQTGRRGAEQLVELVVRHGS
jgi:hypothetical protein